jgi:hypothetical protein
MCFSRNTFFVWKREKRPIISLLEKYYSKEELQEFLETGKISKQDRLKELLEIEKKYNKIVGFIKNESQ